MGRIKDAIQYELIIQPLNHTRLKPLGLVPLTATGYFCANMADKLLMICEKDPTYHVSTLLPRGIEVNQFLPDGFLYMLCSGDKNPELIYYRTHTWEHYVWLKLHWFDTDQL